MSPCALTACPLGAAANNTGAIVDPGNDVNRTGILNTKNFTANSGAHLALQLGGTTAGLGSNGDGTNSHDALKVTGAVSLGNVDLQLSLINNFGSNLHVGDKFLAIINDGTDLVSGTFAQGVSATVGGDVFAINYANNADGEAVPNDVSPTVAAVPEPSTWVLLIGGVALLFILRRKPFSLTQTQPLQINL
jgi:PEP-CTERM motif-containing protein